MPGAKARGLVSHWLRLSQFHVPPFFASASEKAKPLPCPIGSPSTPQRFGPSWFGAALVGVVAGHAFVEDLLARRRIGLGEIGFDRLLGRGAARAFLLHAGDRIAHLLGAFAEEHLAGDDR